MQSNVSALKFWLKGILLFMSGMNFRDPLYGVKVVGFRWGIRAQLNSAKFEDTFLKPTSYCVTEKNTGSYLLWNAQHKSYNTIVEIKAINPTAQHREKGMRVRGPFPLFDHAVLKKWLLDLIQSLFNYWHSVDW